MKIAESSLNGQKTLWVKEKLLLTSNSLLPTVFSKGLFPRGVIVWEWVEFSMLHMYKKYKPDKLLTEKEISMYRVITRKFNPLPDNKILDWSKLKQIAGYI